MFNEAQYNESLAPINNVLLCVISGIIGLVITGFTGWHLSLAYRGQTTIECLEKTRYLSPLRQSMRKHQFGNENDRYGQSYGQQLAEIHANALPGVTRTEEGELMLQNEDLEQGQTPLAFESSRKAYSEIERSRERKRYEDYLDEQDSEKLPSAFDLGWRRNLLHLFGYQPSLWWLPICNTTGDGWHWEPSPKWVQAREAIRRERENRWQEQEFRGRDAYHPRLNGPNVLPERWPSRRDPERHFLTTTNGVISVPHAGNRSPNKADQILGRTDEYFDRNHDDGSPSSRMSMKTLRLRSSFSENSDEDDEYDISSDEEHRNFNGNDSHAGRVQRMSPFNDQPRSEDVLRKLD